MLEPKTNISLAELSTIGLGGKAKYFFDVETKDQIREVLDWCQEKNTNYLVVGGLSNILFSDHDFEGAIIRPTVQDIVVTDQSEDAWTVKVHAGHDWDAFVLWSIENDLSGIECLSGIPGKVGASPIQNIGAYGQEVSQTIVEVEIFDIYKKEFKTLSGEECQFSYRNSKFKMAEEFKDIVWSVTFKLKPFGDPLIKYTDLLKRAKSNHGLKQKPAGKERLLALRNTVLEIRKEKSMVLHKRDKNSRSLGSFFLNPIIDKKTFEELTKLFADKELPYFSTEGGYKISAAWLMEQAGFHKGYEHKGVGLSKNHCLAIVNHDGTTKQVKELANIIQTTIEDKYGVTLKPEPNFV